MELHQEERVTLFDALVEILKPWAFDEFGDSCYVTRGNVAYVKAHLKKRGLVHVRVFAKAPGRNV